MNFSEVMPSKNNLKDVFDNIIMPASEALEWIESNGMLIDQKKLVRLTKGYAEKLKSIEDEINGYPEVIKISRETKKPFNLDSPAQMNRLLFDELQLQGFTSGKKTNAGKLSTDKTVIEELTGKHPIIDLIQEYKQYITLYKMFIKPMPEFICSDGRIHSTYNVNGTVTGRLSCQAPNMQQIPRNKKDDDTKEFTFDAELNIKHLFIPAKGCILVQADYSQMELRVLADYSNDAFLIQAFKDDKDIHLATGEKLAGKPIDKKSEWRTRAKTINFGLIYGKQAMSLGKELGVSTAQAEKFIEHYFKEMPLVRTWLEQTKTFALDNGYVSSMFGRIRRLGQTQAALKHKVEEALRQATNMPIQSTASDYTLSGIINLYQFIKENDFDTKIIATVHDSIIFEIPKKEIATMLEEIPQLMENPQNKCIYWKRQVPLKADIEYSATSWATLKNLE